jgi:predicted TIM-barrel fold metal-dependent hydrolase
MRGPTSRELRENMDHPVVDVDGHFVEMAPVLHDEIVATLEELGGSTLRDRYLEGPVRPTDTSTILAGRSLGGVRDVWSAMPSWWGWPVENVTDRATAHLPGLLHERLDELGIDFTVLYPSMTLSFLEVDDAELSAALCRATNRHHARSFGPYADRMTVGALIPMHTPEIAIAELRYAVEELGYKAAVIAAYARRPIAKLEREHGRLSPPVYRLDHFGIDSEYDYDPFWQACVDLRVAPAVHSSVQYHDLSRSVSSYVYNHIDGIAKCHEALAKSLVLGGVPHRFPDLRIAFLEGGVAWASMLFTGLLGHWEKRNGRQITKLDPSKLNVDELMKLVEAHGTPDVVARSAEIRAWFGAQGAAPEQLDEFAASGITRPSDLRAQFDRSFFMGCEADDPLIAWAFADEVNPMNARFNAVFGSDISHWDVPDMTHPVAEAWEGVDDGRITEDDFRDFVFVNPVRLHAGANPDFFRGTVIEGMVGDALREEEVSPEMQKALDLITAEFGKPKR